MASASNSTGAADDFDWETLYERNILELPKVHVSRLVHGNYGTIRSNSDYNSTVTENDPIIRSVLNLNRWQGEDEDEAKESKPTFAKAIEPPKKLKQRLAQQMNESNSGNGKKANMAEAGKQPKNYGASNFTGATAKATPNYMANGKGGVVVTSKPLYSMVAAAAVAMSPDGGAVSPPRSMPAPGQGPAPSMPPSNAKRLSNLVVSPRKTNSAAFAATAATTTIQCRTRADLQSLATRFNVKALDYKDYDFYPSVVEDLVSNMCSNLSINALRQIKIKIDTLLANKIREDEIAKAEAFYSQRHPQFSFWKDNLSYYRRYGNNAFDDN